MRKILFVQKGDLSEANPNIIKVLESRFPEYPLEVFDIELDFINRQKFIRRINWLFMIFEYGYGIIFKKKKIYFCYHRTSFLFKRIKHYFKSSYDKNDYLFVIQTQSIFYAEIPGIPFFVYTDGTVLSNLNFRNIDHGKYIFHSKSWIELEKTIYENAALNFVFSSFYEKSLIEQYRINPEKVINIHAGANPKYLDNPKKEKDYKGRKILFAGKDWERKGGPLLTEAFKKVLVKYPDCQLIIVGCKPDVKISNCIIYGKVSLEELENHYDEATIFCMPSLVEYFGIVYIDAMNHKLPVVASNIGSVPDFVINGTNGYLINYGDVEGIANAITELLDDPEKCKNFGESGYEIVQKDFTWEKVGEKLEKHISGILKMNS
jgi:glycosyltransferase involved in cell wall biosynthesis